MSIYPTLVLPPNFNVQEQYPDHTFEIQLGDGYTYNSVSTNQPTRAEWTIKRNGLSKEEIDELVEKLSAWGSITPFYWQPHPGVRRKLYFCEKWTVTPIGFKHYEFSATFIEDIRGECLELAALIDSDDIESKLNDASTFLTNFTGNTGDYIIRSTNNLVCRTLHSHSEPIPSTHGTLYDQVTLALACIYAYEYTQSNIWLNRAINYANAIIDNYYNSSPGAGTYLPHWLFDIKSDNRLEEIYPTAGTLSAGQVNAPFAYIPMLWELYEKLAEHNSTESKWQTLANSTRTDYLNLCLFTKQTIIYRKNSGVVNEYPGTELLGGSTSRISTGTLDQFGSVSGISILTIQNTLLELAITSSTSFSSELSANIGDSIIEFFVSTSIDSNDETKIYKHYIKLGAANLINVKTINSRNLYKWDNVLWNIERGLTSGTGTYESQSINYNGLTSDNVVLRLNETATLNVDLAYSSRTPFNFFIKVENNSSIIRLQDGSGRWWDFVTSVNDWSLLNLTWGVFNWSPINGISQGSITPDANANIQTVQIIVTSGSVVYLWWVNKITPEALPMPNIIYRSGVRFRPLINKTLAAGNILVNNSPSDVLYKTPGLVPFSRTVESGNLTDSVIGLPHISYQDPYTLQIWADNEKLNNILDFLENSKNNYGKVLGESGPFTPAYNWSDAQNKINLEDINTFIFNTNDFLATSGEYQAETLLRLAKSWFLKKSDSRLKELVMGWLQWADQKYTSRAGLIPPINFASDNLAAGGDNPGVQALIGESALLANLSGGDPAITFRNIKRTLDYLETQFVIPGSPMSGSWSASQASYSINLKRYYSWWHGACIRFYCNLLKYKNFITYPSCSEPLSIITTQPIPNNCCNTPKNSEPCGVGLWLDIFNDVDEPFTTTVPKSTAINSCRLNLLIDQVSSSMVIGIPKNTTQWLTITSGRHFVYPPHPYP